MRIRAGGIDLGRIQGQAREALGLLKVVAAALMGSENRRDRRIWSEWVRLDAVTRQG